MRQERNAEMHPVLFSIGRLTIYSYGFMIAVGIPLAGISVVMFLYFKDRGSKRYVRR